MTEKQAQSHMPDPALTVLHRVPTSQPYQHAVDRTPNVRHMSPTTTPHRAAKTLFHVANLRRSQSRHMPTSSMQNIIILSYCMGAVPTIRQSHMSGWMRRGRFPFPAGGGFSIWFRSRAVLNFHAARAAQDRYRSTSRTSIDDTDADVDVDVDPQLSGLARQQIGAVGRAGSPEARDRHAEVKPTMVRAILLRKRGFYAGCWYRTYLLRIWRFRVAAMQCNAEQLGCGRWSILRCCPTPYVSGYRGRIWTTDAQPRCEFQSALSLSRQVTLLSPGPIRP